MKTTIKNIFIELVGGPGLKVSERVAGIWWALSLVALCALCEGPFWLTIVLFVNFWISCRVVSRFGITEDGKEDYFIER